MADDKIHAHTMKMLLRGPVPPSSQAASSSSKHGSRRIHSARSQLSATATVSGVGSRPNTGSTLGKVSNVRHSSHPSSAASSVTHRQCRRLEEQLATCPGGQTSATDTELDPDLENALQAGIASAKHGCMRNSETKVTDESYRDSSMDYRSTGEIVLSDAQNEFSQSENQWTESSRGYRRLTTSRPLPKGLGGGSFSSFVARDNEIINVLKSEYEAERDRIERFFMTPVMSASQLKAKDRMSVMGQTKVPPQHWIVRNMLDYHKKVDGKKPDSELYSSTTVFPSETPSNRPEVFLLARSLDTMLGEVDDLVEVLKNPESCFTAPDGSDHDVSENHPYANAIQKVCQIFDVGLSEIARQIAPVCIERACLMDTLRQCFLDITATSADAIVFSNDTANRAVATSIESSYAVESMSEQMKVMEDELRVCKDTILEQEQLIAELTEKSNRCDFLEEQLSVRKSTAESDEKRRISAQWLNTANLEMTSSAVQASRIVADASLDLEAQLEKEKKDKLAIDEKRAGEARSLYLEAVRYTQLLERVVDCTNGACQPMYDRSVFTRPTLNVRVAKGKWSDIAEIVARHELLLDKREKALKYQRRVAEERKLKDSAVTGRSTIDPSQRNGEQNSSVHADKREGEMYTDSDGAPPELVLPPPYGLDVGGITRLLSDTTSAMEEVAERLHALSESALLRDSVTKEAMMPPDDPNVPCPLCERTDATAANEKRRADQLGKLHKEATARYAMYETEISELKDEKTRTGEQLEKLTRQLRASETRFMQLQLQGQPSEQSGASEKSRQSIPFLPPGMDLPLVQITPADANSTPSSTPEVSSRKSSMPDDVSAEGDTSQVPSLSVQHLARKATALPDELPSGGHQLPPTPVIADSEHSGDASGSVSPPRRRDTTVARDDDTYDVGQLGTTQTPVSPEPLPPKDRSSSPPLVLQIEINCNCCGGGTGSPPNGMPLILSLKSPLNKSGGTSLVGRARRTSISSFTGDVDGDMDRKGSGLGSGRYGSFGGTPSRRNSLKNAASGQLSHDSGESAEFDNFRVFESGDYSSSLQGSRGKDGARERSGSLMTPRSDYSSGSMPRKFSVPSAGGSNAIKTETNKDSQQTETTPELRRGSVSSKFDLMSFSESTTGADSSESQTKDSKLRNVLNSCSGVDLVPPERLTEDDVVPDHLLLQDAGSVHSPADLEQAWEKAAARVLKIDSPSSIIRRLSHSGNDMMRLSTGMSKQLSAHRLLQRTSSSINPKPVFKQSPNMFQTTSVVNDALRLHDKISTLLIRMNMMDEEGNMMPNMPKPKPLPWLLHIISGFNKAKLSSDSLAAVTDSPVLSASEFLNMYLKNLFGARAIVLDTLHKILITCKRYCDSDVRVGLFVRMVTEVYNTELSVFVLKLSRAVEECTYGLDYAKNPAVFSSDDDPFCCQLMSLDRAVAVFEQTTLHGRPYAVTALRIMNTLSQDCGDSMFNDAVKHQQLPSYRNSDGVLVPRGWSAQKIGIGRRVIPKIMVLSIVSELEFLFRSAHPEEGPM